MQPNIAFLFIDVVVIVTEFEPETVVKVLKANSSIVDGHFTTLISCFILFYFGSSFVKGFAATLGIGVLVSLFTALACTKTFLRFFTSYQQIRQIKFFIPINKYHLLLFLVLFF